MDTKTATHPRHSLARSLVGASLLLVSCEAARAASAPDPDLEAVIEPLAAYPSFVLDETLGAGILGLDAYTVSCPAGTAQVVFGFQGLNLNSNPLVTMIVSGGRTGVATAASIGSSRSDAGPAVAVVGPAGNYSMSITKAAVTTKPVFYTAYAHCEAADGALLNVAAHLDIDR